MYFINHFFVESGGVTDVAVLRDWRTAKQAMIDHCLLNLLSELCIIDIYTFSETIPEKIYDYDFSFKYHPYSVNVVTFGADNWVFTVNQERFLVERDVKL